MREAIIAEGYSPPLIGTGFLPAGTQHASTAAFEAEYGYLYDFTNSYGAFWYPDDERGSIRDPPVTQSELAVNQATIRSRHATSPAQVPHVPSYPLGFWPVMECSCWGKLTDDEKASMDWLPSNYWGCVSERLISVPTADDFR